MRFNLITHCSQAAVNGRRFPVCLTLMPSCGIPGDYRFDTDVDAVIRMLEQDTDLPSSVIRGFEREVYNRQTAHIRGVVLKDKFLTGTGYFIVRRNASSQA